MKGLKPITMGKLIHQTDPVTNHRMRGIAPGIVQPPDQQFIREIGHATLSRDRFVHPDPILTQNRLLLLGEVIVDKGRIQPAPRRLRNA